MFPTLSAANQPVRSSSKKTFSAKLSCQMSDRPEEWVGIEASQGIIFCSLSMFFIFWMKNATTAIERGILGAPVKFVGSLLHLFIAGREGNIAKLLFCTCKAFCGELNGGQSRLWVLFLSWGDSEELTWQSLDPTAGVAWTTSSLQLCHDWFEFQLSGAQLLGLPRTTDRSELEHRTRIALIFVAFKFTTATILHYYMHLLLC